MKLRRYGVTLKRLTRNDLELLRTWRNSEQVNKHMEFREHITKEMQEKWFVSIDNPNNNYYIIIYKNEKIGLINEKGYNRFADNTTESGIFIADKKNKNSFVPILASLTLLEISFFFLGGKQSYIKILKSNSTSIKYNKQLGYKLCENQDNIENQRYFLTCTDFINSTYKLRKAALQISKDPNMYVIWEPHDYESGMAQEGEILSKKYELEVNNKWENGEHIYYCKVDIENPTIRQVEPDEQTPYKYYDKRK